MALDLNNLYQELSEHVYHDLSCVAYVKLGSTEYDNVAIECNDCGMVLFDADRPTEADPEADEFECAGCHKVFDIEDSYALLSELYCPSCKSSISHAPAELLAKQEDADASS